MRYAALLRSPMGLATARSGKPSALKSATVVEESLAANVWAIATGGDRVPTSRNATQMTKRHTVATTGAPLLTGEPTTLNVVRVEGLSIPTYIWSRRKPPAAQASCRR